LLIDSELTLAIIWIVATVDSSIFHNPFKPITPWRIIISLTMNITPIFPWFFLHPRLGLGQQLLQQQLAASAASDPKAAGLLQQQLAASLLAQRDPHGQLAAAAALAATQGG
jgi:hypothetical protein